MSLTDNVTIEGEIVTDATLTDETETVTARVAVFEPSTVVTVIVAVPLERAVTRPDEDTVVILVFELDHVTDLLVAFDGIITGLTWYV